MSSVKAAVAVIKHSKLQTREQFEEIFKLNFLSQGSYRKVYQIGNLPLVVKIEYADSEYRHTKKEIAAQAVLRASKIKRHIPPFYYTAPGVIVMPLYKSCGDMAYRRVEERLRERIQDAGFQPYDFHYANIMQDARGTVKIIDMGLFVRNVI